VKKVRGDTRVKSIKVTVMSKKKVVSFFFQEKIGASVAAPGDTNPSYATDYFLPTGTSFPGA